MENKQFHIPNEMYLHIAIDFALNEQKVQINGLSMNIDSHNVLGHFFKI